MGCESRLAERGVGRGASGGGGGRGLTYANIFIVRFRRDIAVVAQLA